MTSRSGLFGRDKFAAGSHKYVTITEGEQDACSLFQVLNGPDQSRHIPVVSVRSSSSAVTDVAMDRIWLDSFERVYLAFDGDAPGREATAKVAKLFHPDRVYHVKLTKRKDASEYLQAGEEAELKRIWWNSKRYLPETIISSLTDFKALLEEPPKFGVPYPFPTITEMTYGLRRGESVLITAQEGVGKTELLHTIEHNLIKATQDNVAAFFLEEQPRRHLQALAGIEMGKPIHLPDCKVGLQESYDVLETLLGMDERLFLSTHFGSDDPDVVLDTIRFLVVGRSCSWVLLDHITMVVSGRHEEDERKALDYFSTQIEMMVKELNFGLIIVSHVNDNGQTRGSRYISKVADIRIDLTRDVEAGDNTIHAVISKNRFCGKTGPAGAIIFDPVTYKLSEADNDNGYINKTRAA